MPTQYCTQFSRQTTEREVTRRQQGFTLIEILIAVAIVGIIAAVAIPSYGKYVRTANRNDATAVLSKIAGEQYQFFSENNRYAATLSELGYPADTVVSQNGNYSASVTASTATSYTLSAAPVAGSGQEHDAECASLTLNSIGTKGTTGTGTVADCW